MALMLCVEGYSVLDMCRSAILAFKKMYWKFILVLNILFSDPLFLSAAALHNCTPWKAVGHHFWYCFSVRIKVSSFQIFANYFYILKLHMVYFCHQAINTIQDSLILKVIPYYTFLHLFLQSVMFSLVSPGTSAEKLYLSSFCLFCCDATCYLNPLWGCSFRVIYLCIMLPFIELSSVLIILVFFVLFCSFNLDLFQSTRHQ